MDYIIDAFLRAFWLILSLDREIVSIALRSLWVAGTATVLATLIGVPLAYVMTTRDFPGKRIVLTIFDTLMALPTVIVGLFGYAFLSRRGPLGFLDLLFTPTGMVIGDLILALPLIVALTIAAVNAVDPRVRLTALALGATSRQTSWTVLLEARYALMSAVINGFGRVVAEVGAAMMLGGNIRGYTRTLTTAVALETSKGEFAFAMALGLILLTLALMVNLLLRRLQEV
jgi:tungstate transport system permease protein